MSATSSPVPAGEMTLFEHLAELRDRLFKSVAALAVGTIIGYVLFPDILGAILGPYCDVPAAFRPNADVECALVAQNVLEAFSTRMKVSLITGAFFAGPILFYQLWRFISPGLTTKERRLALPFVVISQLLFGAGLAFSAFVIPRGLTVLLGFGGDQITPLLSAGNYVSFVVTTGVAFGIVFELPVILIFLALLGVVTSTSLRKFRSYAIVLNVVVAAVVTPTTDALTLFFMAGPMLLFYEISILAAWLIERRRAKRTVATT